MSGLEQAFYILAIIFMSLMFLMIAALVIGVFIIRSKINRIHDNIENKLNVVTSAAEAGGALTSIAGKQVVKQARKAIKKAKK